MRYASRTNSSEFIPRAGVVTAHYSGRRRITSPVQNPSSRTASSGQETYYPYSDRLTNGALVGRARVEIVLFALVKRGATKGVERWCSTESIFIDEGENSESVRARAPEPRIDRLPSGGGGFPRSARCDLGRGVKARIAQPAARARAPPPPSQPVARSCR